LVLRGVHRDATDKLVKCLAPKAGPKNRAKKLVKTGEKMQEVDRNTVRFLSQPPVSTSPLAVADRCPLVAV
jgi:hypothetical protein